MKKFFVGALALMVASTGILSGCKLFGGSTSGFIASNDLISYGAYSTVSLLSSFSGMTSEHNLLGGNLNQNILLSEGSTQTEVETQIDLFHKYYSMLAPFVDNETKNVMNYVNLGEDLQYKYIMQVNIALGGGETQSMILKYNIGEQSIEYDDDDEDEYGFAEVESRFSGVLVIGETVYNFEGISEIEQDEEEFEIKAEIDSENYVKMKIERELGELEYEYEISVNGVVKIVSVEIEEDEDMEFSIELEIDNDGVQSSYTLKRELNDDVLVTKVEYDVNGESGEMYVNKTTDEFGNEIIEYSINPFVGEQTVVQKEFKSIFGDMLS